MLSSSARLQDWKRIEDIVCGKLRFLFVEINISIVYFILIFDILIIDNYMAYVL